jgi:hypothetical protein
MYSNGCLFFCLLIWRIKLLVHKNAKLYPRWLRIRLGIVFSINQRWASQVKKLPQVQVKSSQVKSSQTWWLDLTCKDFARPWLDLTWLGKILKYHWLDLTCKDFARPWLDLTWLGKILKYHWLDLTWLDNFFETSTCLEIKILRFSNYAPGFPNERCECKHQLYSSLVIN